jgi:hypothetical protein
MPWLAVLILAGCINKDRKQGSEELCGPGHERWATKPSSCGSKVTVFVSLTRESCTFCVDIDFLRSTPASWRRARLNESGLNPSPVTTGTRPRSEGGNKHQGLRRRRDEVLDFSLAKAFDCACSSKRRRDDVADAVDSQDASGPHPRDARVHGAGAGARQSCGPPL